MLSIHLKNMHFSKKIFGELFFFTTFADVFKFKLNNNEEISK